LRNNDVDEFFKIYDTAVPKDLPEDQVNIWKSRHVRAVARAGFQSRWFYFSAQGTFLERC
jgi:hypothetical protein